MMNRRNELSKLDNQELLMRYLIEKGAPMHCTLFIVGTLWKDELIMEIFRYIAEHPDADYHQLYLITCKIAKREGLI